jgi:hypothetical protein
MLEKKAFVSECMYSKYLIINSDKDIIEKFTNQSLSNMDAKIT